MTDKEYAKLLDARREANKLYCKLFDISETMGEEYATDVRRWPDGLLKQITFKLGGVLGIYGGSPYRYNYDRIMDIINEAKTELAKLGY